MATDTDRFFLSINYRAKDWRQFLERKHLGVNTFDRIVKEVIISGGISGTGSKMWTTAHVLRGTFTSLLLAAGHSDSSVFLRTGDRDPRSLRNYHHLQVAEGLRLNVMY